MSPIEMADVDAWEVERELARVVDRLGTLPLSRAAAAQGDVHACALELVAISRRLGVPIPADVAVPDLAPQGSSALIAVLGRDCLLAAHDADALRAINDALVALRRALP